MADRHFDRASKERSLAWRSGSEGQPDSGVTLRDTVFSGMSGWLSLGVLACTACGRIAFDPLGSGDAAPTGPVTGSHLVLADPAETLADFPLLVVLDDTRADRATIGDGSTLRFVDDSGAVLAHEIEQLGASGGPPLIAWVRVPQLDPQTTITVEYGPGVPARSTQPVWGPEFAAVYHFAGSGTTDSSMSGFTATDVGTQPSNTSLGLGRDLTQSAMDHMVMPTATTLSYSAFTVSAFVLIRTQMGVYQAVLTREFGDTTDNDVYLGIVGNKAVMTCEPAGTEQSALDTRALALQTFHYLTGVATATNAKIFVDGVLDVVGGTGAALTPSNRPLFIGADRGDIGTPVDVPCCDFLDGIVDEIRLQTVARSDAWVAYDSLSVHDTVITYGPVLGL